MADCIQLGRIGDGNQKENSSHTIRDRGYFPTLSQEALHSYRTLTGKLIRAGGERPELLYAIQELRRHFDDAKQNDFVAAKRLALYLRGTLEKVLQLGVNGPFATPETLHQLEVHAISGAAGTSTADCHSTSGGAVWIEGFLLHAWSETQPTIACSRQEAEFVAANLCAREGLFVTAILEEIGLHAELHLFTDSADTFGSRARLGAEQAHDPKEEALWLLEELRERRLEVFPVPSRLNVADVFTRALPRERFEQLTDVLGVRDT